MKTHWMSLLLFGFASLFIMPSCETIPEKNDKCEETKMAEPKNPVVYIRLYIPDKTLPVMNHNLLNAEKLTVTGSITKIYCNGKISSKFDFNPTFFPLESDYYYMTSGILLDQPYQFYFDNEKDNLLVIMTFKAFFLDGKIYESGEMVYNYYFDDIWYNVNSLKHGIDFMIADPLNWFEVTE